MKNAREEAIARCYAALTSLLILIGQLDEMGGQEDEVERLREQAAHARRRAEKALQSDRKYSKTRHLLDISHELVLTETLILLHEADGTAPPRWLQQARTHTCTEAHLMTL